MASASTTEVRTLGDLREILHALDIAYFGRELSALGADVRWARWAPTKKWLTFASVFPEDRIIHVHQGLAWKWVPEVVVLGTLHHEALHVILGLHEHTREFKLAEKSFLHFPECVAWETRENVKLVREAPKPPRDIFHLSTTGG